MDKKISVIIKRPGSVPYKTNISNNLLNLQKTVDGYIETWQFATDALVICNEEGKINGLPYNCNFLGLDFYGPIIFAGKDGEEFSDFPMEFQEFKKMNPQLWGVN